MTVLGSFSATDLATKHIRDLILSQEMPPGTKINLEELASRLGISRTPVRDALIRLQSEGLVRIVSRVGVYVREISVEEVLEVYSIKASLEPLMAQWATERSSQKERDAYADTADELPDLAASGDSKRYIDVVVARRSRLIEMSRSEVLNSIFGLIDERVRLLRLRNLSRPERRAGSAEEHLAVADAVRRGDAKRAAKLARAHVEASRTALVELTKVAHNGSSDAGGA